MGNAIGVATSTVRQCSCCRTDVSQVVTSHEHLEVDNGDDQQDGRYHDAGGAGRTNLSSATAVDDDSRHVADPPPHVVHDDDDPRRGGPIRSSSIVAEQHRPHVPPHTSSKLFSDAAGGSTTASSSSSSSSSGGYEMPEEQPQEQQAAASAFVGMGQELGAINLSIATAAASPSIDGGGGGGVRRAPADAGVRRSSSLLPVGSEGFLGMQSPSPARPPRGCAVAADGPTKGRTSWDRSGSSSDSDAEGPTGSRRAQLMLTRLRERHMQQQQQQQQPPPPHQKQHQPPLVYDDNDDDDDDGPREDMPAAHGALRL